MRAHHLQKLSVIAALLLLASSPSSSAGQAVDRQAPLDIRSLVEAAVQNVTSASETHTRFTNFELAHFMYFDSAGKKYGDRTDLFEQTWINDIHYDRLVELDGKPLTGRALEAERKRYDDAIAQRGQYGLKEHSGGRVLSTDGVDFRNALKLEYALREVGRKKSAEGEFRVVEASLIGKAPPDAKCPWKYTLWILESPPRLMYYRADAKDSKSKQCRNAMGEVTYQVVEGYPVVSHDRTVTFVPDPSGYIRAEADYTYTKYRLFTTSMILKFDGAMIDPGPVSPPPSKLPPNQ
jgi:hypothetical protein